MLSNEPLRKWLRPYLLDTTVKELARHIGVDDTGLRRIVEGHYKKSQLDIIDKIFCRLGDPGALRREYPSLYTFTPEQELEAEAWANEL